MAIDFASLPIAALRSVFALKGHFAEAEKPKSRRNGNVDIAPFLNGALATATISADFEIAWAFRGRSDEERLTRGTRCRHNVPLILRMLDRLNVPITWATVGHLFLHECQRSTCGKAHAEMPRPPKNARWEGDWYRHDPCTNLEKDPHWYAPDLIELIRTASARHEIGSHSFSHIDFSPDTSTEELVVREMETCKSVMAPLGLPLRSLVYPFNNMGHHYHKVLRELGITTVRHRAGAKRLSYPVRSESGIYLLYESMNLRTSSLYDYVDKAKIFLEEAMKQTASYHLWFHPSDPTELFEKEFLGIITVMSELQRAGSLWIATMGALAAYCEARAATSLKADAAQNGLTISVTSTYDRLAYGSTPLTIRVFDARTPKSCSVRNRSGSQKVDHRPANSSSEGFWVNIPDDAEIVEIRF